MMNRGAIETMHARGVLGWSQRELSRRAGLSSVFVCHLEAGKRKPGRSVSMRLRDLLGVPLESWDQPADPTATAEGTDHG